MRPQAPQFSASARRSRQVPLHALSVPAHPEEDTPASLVPESGETPPSGVGPASGDPASESGPASAVTPASASTAPASEPASASATPASITSPASGAAWTPESASTAAPESAGGGSTRTGRQAPSVHASAAPHCAQAPPRAPQVIAVTPETHVPSTVQQPEQLAGPQAAGGGGVAEQPTRTDSRSAEQERMTPAPVGPAPCAASNRPPRWARLETSRSNHLSAAVSRTRPGPS